MTNQLQQPDEELVRDSHECQTGDRLTYYCIPTPGENAWVKEVIICVLMLRMMNDSYCLE